MCVCVYMYVAIVLFFLCCFTSIVLFSHQTRLNIQKVYRYYLIIIILSFIIIILKLSKDSLRGRRVVFFFFFHPHYITLLTLMCQTVSLQFFFVYICLSPSSSLSLAFCVLFLVSFRYVCSRLRLLITCVCMFFFARAVAQMH